MDLTEANSIKRRLLQDVQRASDEIVSLYGVRPEFVIIYTDVHNHNSERRERIPTGIELRLEL
jgi:hypothetical protein